MFMFLLFFKEWWRLVINQTIAVYPSVTNFYQELFSFCCWLHFSSLCLYHKAYLLASEWLFTPPINASFWTTVSFVSSFLRQGEIPLEVAGLWKPCSGAVLVTNVLRVLIPCLTQCCHCKTMLDKEFNNHVTVGLSVFSSVSFWLCCVCCGVGFALVVVSRPALWLRGTGCSWQCLLVLRSTGSRSSGFGKCSVWT